MDSENRLITLTHRTQIRSFTTDLLKIIRSIASKQGSTKNRSSLDQKAIRERKTIVSFIPVIDLLNVLSSYF